MKLNSIQLRGAKGILDGLGVEELAIDFTQFEPGLICLCGPNGAGKTTLVENLVPYRTLFSRAGSLAHHFALKNSCRNLHFSLNGDDFQALLNIDGESNSGKIESFLYRNGEPVNPDGKEGSYNEAVFKLFGKPELFQRANFMPQKRTPLHKVPPANRKDLILELIAKRGIQAFSDAAGDRAKELLLELGKIELEMAELERRETEIGDVKERMRDKKIWLDNTLARRAELEGAIANASQVIDDLVAKAAQQAVIKSRLESVGGELRKLDAKLGEESDLYTSVQTRYTAQIDDEKVLLEKLVKLSESDIAELKAKAARLPEAKSKFEELRGRKEKSDALAPQLKEAQAAIERYGVEYENRDAKLVDKTKAAKRSAELLEEVPCQAQSLPADISSSLTSPYHDEASTIDRIFDVVVKTQEACRSCPLLENAIKARASLPELENEAVYLEAEAEKRYAELDADIQRLRSELETIGFDADAYKAAWDEYHGLMESNPEAALRAIETNSEKRANLEKRIADTRRERSEQLVAISERMKDLDGQRDLLKVEESELKGQFDSSLESELAQAKDELNTKQAELSKAKDLIARVETWLDQAEALLRELDEKQARHAELRAQRRAIEMDAADWTDLSAKLSKNGGFQSYLVESAGTQITPFANELLAQYGKPWTIEIATVKPSADGKKMVEGFYIFINTPDGQRELADLSGGQEVWIDGVIYHAITHMMRKQGILLQTQIMDEADGALDADKAMAYLRAVQLAHELSGLHHTILITHRPEIQEMIPQRIRLMPGQGVQIEVE